MGVCQIDTLRIIVGRDDAARVAYESICQVIIYVESNIAVVASCRKIAGMGVRRVRSALLFFLGFCSQGLRGKEERMARRRIKRDDVWMGITLYGSYLRGVI